MALIGSSEKLMKYDVKRREYDVVVIGEESHLAYNRVGLTSFFQHRQVENLYLNPKEWVRLDISKEMGSQLIRV
jgi:nitrite reductase (NAD(P)H)